VLLAAFFMLPIVASVLTYRFFNPAATANHGELLLPPAPITTQEFIGTGGQTFRFPSLAGKWVFVVSDSGRCEAGCQAKLYATRQVRIALGRDASRVERVFVIDDLAPVDAKLVAEHPGLSLATTPKGASPPPGVVNDRAHIYLVDPRGNVMMRWPGGIEPKRVLADMKRLLKASQIG
jgi:cytochrome oxidase Cu insertion factor (SCO1/SenC/PrrC family)